MIEKLNYAFWSLMHFLVIVVALLIGLVMFVAPWRSNEAINKHDG